MAFGSCQPPWQLNIPQVKNHFNAGYRTYSVPSYPCSKLQLIRLTPSHQIFNLKLRNINDCEQKAEYTFIMGLHSNNKLMELYRVSPDAKERISPQQIHLAARHLSVK